MMKSPHSLRVFAKTAALLILVAAVEAQVEAQQADLLRLTVTAATRAPKLEKAAARANAAAPVVVEVRDEAGLIVPGARVELKPAAGASQLAWTDTEGRAFLATAIPRGQEGKSPIVAEARFNGKSGSVTFNQGNAPPPDAQIARTLTFNRPDHKLRNTLIVAGIVAGAALAVALALTLPGGSSSAAAATTVTVGGISVGGPR